VNVEPLQEYLSSMSVAPVPTFALLLQLDMYSEILEEDRPSLPKSEIRKKALEVSFDFILL
jgi:hypothetical protein